MGKRGAVRNNSGLPVDHSGPGLRVGPTTPPTADRKSEACPPDSGFDSDLAFGLAVDSGFDSHFSQHKSGRESESGALSDAREASGGLRSEATQRGWASSLDSIQINRNKSYESVFCSTPRGRNRNCGRFTVAGTAAGTKITRYFRVDCKCWNCRYCGPKKARRYKRAIREMAESKRLNRFLTLTLDPKLIGSDDPVIYINKAFAKWRTYVKRKFGVSITYIRVLEFQTNGNPHFHILVDRFIPQAWVKQSWSAVGGGRFVDIRFVDLHRISRYLSKYLTKELLLSAPMRSRRVTVSRGLRLIQKSKTNESWRLHRISIWILFEQLVPDLSTVELDEEGVLRSFATE
jgi:hypothetical protein